MNFELLISELHVARADGNEHDLGRLEQWCHEHVSQDIQYHDTESSRRYQRYLNLARNYLDFFLPLATADSDKPIPLFDNLNLIQYAAQSGYHYFIEQQQAIRPEAVNKANNDLMTPLHLSASYGFLYTVNALLHHGACPLKKNKEGQTPLFFALLLPISYKPYLLTAKIELFNTLIKASPDSAWLSQDNGGNTLLHWMVQHDDLASLILSALEKAPSLVFQANNASRFPIHTAILNNQLENTKQLLSIDKVVELTDARQQTPLHYAARYSTRPLITCCLHAKPQALELKDGEGKTPLLLAAQANNLDGVRYLISEGADRNTTDAEGYTPLFYAKHNGNKLMQELLI